MIFRAQNNVPEVYVNESRDFQLLCRLKDALFGGVKYTIDSLNHTSNTMEINSTLLPLLKSKVGFFEEETLTEEELRYLLAGFSDIIRYKGSKKAIIKAVCLWFRVNRLQGRIVDIVVDNDTYQVKLRFDVSSFDTKLLDEIFKYILPAGYIVDYAFVKDSAVSSNYLFIQNYEGFNIHNFKNSNIRDYDLDNITSDIQRRLIGSVGVTEIMSYEDLQAKDETITTIDYKKDNGEEND